MKKKLALEEIEKAKNFYLHFSIYDVNPLLIKVNKKNFKNLVRRFKDEDIIDLYTMIYLPDNELSIFFVSKINY